MGVSLGVEGGAVGGGTLVVGCVDVVLLAAEGSKDFTKASIDLRSTGSGVGVTLKFSCPLKDGDVLDPPSPPLCGIIGSCERDGFQESVAGAGLLDAVGINFTNKLSIAVRSTGSGVGVTLITSPLGVTLTGSGLAFDLGALAAPKPLDPYYVLVSKHPVLMLE